MNAVIIIYKKTHSNENRSLRAQNHCVLWRMILLFSTLLSRTFFLWLCQNLIWDSILRNYFGSYRKAKNTNFLYIHSFYMYGLFKGNNCILMNLLISALFYVNIRDICHDNYVNDWGYTLRVKKSQPNVKIYNIYYKLLLPVGYWKLILKVYA